MLKHQLLYYYNQAFHLDDFKSGGNCFAYVVMFLSYVSAYLYLYPDSKIDFSNLKFYLEHCKEKKFLQGLQCDHVRTCLTERDGFKLVQDYEKVFDQEVLPLHSTIEITPTRNLRTITQDFLDEIRNINGKPLLFTLHFDDNQVFLGMRLSHIVSLFASSPNEIYLFDANSGLHRIYINNATNAEDLKDTIKNIIFKTNIIMAFAYNSESPTIEYCYTVSKALDKKEQIEILHNLRSISHVPPTVEYSKLFLIIQSWLNRFDFLIQLFKSKSVTKQNQNFFARLFKPKQAMKEEIELNEFPQEQAQPARFF